MANIVIKDLSENVELDRQAMLAIAGGSRLRAGGRFVRPASQKTRLFDPARIAVIQPGTSRPGSR
ncbi:hypothetical protein [Massilia aerilata]|jgi:hypothetical protein|uniref:Uncharacterized protein n=1 Tax=Massilia aerilata TaxID=453817 RepID=A0ABW0RWC8_9BURK